MTCPSERSDVKRREERLAPLGRVLFGLGIVLIVLRGLRFEARLPGVPSFWYANQALWICVGIGMIALGSSMLWGNTQRGGLRWRPATPGRRFRSVTLYTRAGCHLCDDAADLLKSYERWLPQADKVDIDTDTQLVERFDTCVPVVAFDDKVRFRGRIDETLLRRLIDGTPSQSVINH